MLSVDGGGLDLTPAPRPRTPAERRTALEQALAVLRRAPDDTHYILARSWQEGLRRMGWRDING